MGAMRGLSLIHFNLESIAAAYAGIAAPALPAATRSRGRPAGASSSMKV
jgi:hypothetical protein